MTTRPEFWHGSVRTRSFRLAALAALAALLPAAAVAVVAAFGWQLGFGAMAGTGLLLWSISDRRVAVVVAVALASFVNYGGGRLTFELGAVSAWLALIGLVLLWRSAWTGWRLPPSEITPALVAWFALAAYGAVLGLAAGHNVRFLLLELFGAAWPLFGLVVLQVFGRRSLPVAGAGAVIVALLHTVFGLVMLRIVGHRIGNVYFSTVSGIVVVGLWTFALLAPRPRVRLLCLAAMIPPLVHLVFSFTRGYWLGALVGVAVATGLGWIALRRSEVHGGRRILGLGLSLGVVAGTVLLASVLYLGQADILDSLGRRFSSSFTPDAGGETASNFFRLIEYSLALDAIGDAPIFGHGFGYTITMQDPFFGDRREQWIVHNYYLLLWLKTGLLGLAAFGFLMWNLLRGGLRNARWGRDWRTRAWSVACVAITVQVLVISLVNYPLAQSITGFLLAFAWGVQWALVREDAEMREAGASPAGAAGAGAPAS